LFEPSTIPCVTVVVAVQLALDPVVVGSVAVIVVGSIEIWLEVITVVEELVN